MGLEQRRLAAILAADVVGFSRLIGADESGTLARLKRLRQDAIEPKIAEFQGHIVGTAGDSFLIEFGSAADALQCAMEIQQRVAGQNEDLPKDSRMVLRMGINLGDVIPQGETIYGDGVNIAARLEKLADPGGVCIGRSIYDHVKSRPGLHFKELGEIALHNIAEPVRAYSVSSTNLERTTRAAELGGNLDGRTAIAVLPFLNMSGSAEQDYFADGITEDLITELSRYRHLSVVARNTTFAYKGKAVNVPEIGRQLGVDFMVEGSVRQAANRVRVTVQLIDNQTGAHALAEKFDRELTDIFAVQDEIVTAILARLAYNLDDAASAQHQRKPSHSVTAYSLVLRARAAWRNGEEGAARSYLEEAIKIDPHYARALSFLAFLYSYGLFSQSNDLPRHEAAQRVRELVQRAIVIDRTDPFTLQRVAMTYSMIGETARARPFIEAAAAQIPRDIDVMIVKGLILAFSGQHREALDLVEQISRMEKRLPPGHWVGLSDIRYMSIDYQGAYEALNNILNPPWYVAVCQAACLAQMGDTAEAGRLVANASREFDPALLARMYAAACVLPEDAEHWLDGFRKAGVDV